MALDGGYIGSWHHAQAERHNGHADGFCEGVDYGREAGHADGYREGRAQGYREGYQTGWQEHAVAVQPRIDKLNAGIATANQTVERANQTIEKADNDIGRANVIIREKNAKIDALTAELAALKAQHQSMLQAQQQAAAMQAALRKANEKLQQVMELQVTLRATNEQLQQQLQQTADERDAKHALAVERAYRYNRLSVAMAAARDTLREATEAKCESARRIAHIFSTSFERNESEALAKRMILSPLVDDPAFSAEAPRTMQLINDMAFIQRVDLPNRIQMDNEQLYDEQGAAVASLPE